MKGWIWFILIGLYEWGGFLYLLYRVMRAEGDKK